MTEAVREFVRGLGLRGRCLDVGAYDVNGCLRSLFEEYVGLDMRPGPNVDVVAPASAMPFADECFDAVVCVEMLEHDRDPFGSVREMTRVLRRGGTLALAVPGIGFPRHDYPSDYWRMTKDGLGVLMRGLVSVRTWEDADHSYGVGLRAERTERTERAERMEGGR
jgi:SAM-dependent methyltransferase